MESDPNPSERLGAASNYLTDLAARLRSELEGIKRGAAHAIAAGELLIEAKALVAHGEWEDWCRSSGISPRTANHYMRLARHRSAFESANLADLTVTFALATLAPPKPPDPPPPPPAPDPPLDPPLDPPPCSSRRAASAVPPGYKAAKDYLASQGYPVEGGEGVGVPSFFGPEWVGMRGVMELAEAVRGGARPDPVRQVVYRMRELGVTIEQLIDYFERERKTRTPNPSSRRSRSCGAGPAPSKTSPKNSP